MKLNTTEEFNSQYYIKRNSSFSKNNSIGKSNSSSLKSELTGTNKNKIGIISVKMFDLLDNLNLEKRTYLLQFEAMQTKYIAAEILLLNPFFNIKDYSYKGLTIWYLDDEEVGRNNFNFDTNKEWEIIEFVQSWGTPIPGFWKSGEARVEIYLDDKLICKHDILIANEQIVNFQNLIYSDSENFNRQVTSQPKNVELVSLRSNSNISVADMLQELNNLVGLKHLKQSLTDFITYLNFIKERKTRGIDTDEQLYTHCIFIGNPGTGKTTVARLLGKYFKAIGLLEYGHVVEVDRSGLVGEYIGQTAQKTEKAINQALGGILFIDEAYSLKQNNIAQDFGQEAIDILLKRMEDHKNELVVIAAGYPDLMKSFIESNPGLKSRFTHIFSFDDYSSEELVNIMKIFASKERYKLTEEAEQILKNKLESISLDKDESFGNARFIRNIFINSKIQLSKRFQQLPDDEKNFSSLNIISAEDIIEAFYDHTKNNGGSSINIDKMEEYLSEFNNLAGLNEVKTTFNRLLAGIKLEKMKKDRLISSNSRNLNSIFISSPGSGTTHVARLMGKIYKELSLLKNGHLIEIYSNTFSELNKSDSFIKLEKIVDDAAGGVILVNQAVITLNANHDFSDSLLQEFLKRLYLSKDKLITILSGTREEIADLFDAVPLLQNQFPNFFVFDEYSPRQLLDIALNICQKKNYQLDEGAWQELLELIILRRKNNNKQNSTNARTVKEIINKAIEKQEERILSLTEIKDEELMTIKLDDLKLLNVN
jgi:replication-associated recombination protein RarA